MLTREQILALLPHQGTMCLLDGVTAWSAAGIDCGASSHLLPDNPLRRDGRLGAICGIEYGLQAAALHGALTGGATGSCRGVAPVLASWPGLSRPSAQADPAASPHRTRSLWVDGRDRPSHDEVDGQRGDGQRPGIPGYLAALRHVTLHVDRLDDSAFGTLRVTATAELQSASGSIYLFLVASEAGVPLVEGRGTVAFPGPPA